MSDFDKYKDQICTHKGFKRGNYFIGFDIGTNSVGWAVTNEKYELLKFKSHKMWGSRLFAEAQTAVDTRMKRSARRRLQRRKFRLILLESLFSKEIHAVDETFFMRLHESKYHVEDKTNLVKYTLFIDKNYTDVDYYKEFPTIYHLRHHLMTEGTKDIRLLFLAIHHILKYRGNFLYGKKEFSVDGEMYSVLRSTLEELGFGSYVEDESVLQSIANLVLDRGIVRGEKVKQIEPLIAQGKKLSSVEKNRLKAWAYLIMGLKANLVNLFTDEDVEVVLPEEKEFKTINLHEGIYEDVRDAYEDAWGDRFVIVDQCKVLHDIIVISSIIKPGQSLSEAKIESYDQHKDDLGLLKSVLKEDKKLYDDMFVVDIDKGTNYVKYIKQGVNGNTSTTQEAFYKYVRKVLSVLPETEHTKCIVQKIEEGLFLPLQRISKNGVVPYQLHKEELARILEKAKLNFPFLNEVEDGLTVADKIISILEFKIPYYVGPLNPTHSIENGGFAWVVRKEAGQVLPWNFEQKVDVQASAVKFIENLTNKCTYLIDQDVLPKYSLLYAEFSLLNELNNIRVNDKPLPADVKQAFIRDHFMSLQDSKTATKKVVAKYLVDNNYVSQPPIITGMDQQIATKLTSHRDMTRILGEHFDYAMAEDIIRYITIFGESKDMLRQVLKNYYGDRLTTEQIKKLGKLTYTGWGRLSKKFLSDIWGMKKNDDDAEAGTIIEHMREGQENLMQLLSSSYSFIDVVQEYVTNVLGAKEKTAFEMLEDLSLSPMVKRSVWQTLRILDEIVSIRKELPKKIFVEVARTNKADKKRTQSRKALLEELYEQIKDEDVHVLQQELESKEDSALNSKKLYLYFTQMGRCMYSGRRIDIHELFTDTYDIDHIYPRSLTKDDSWHNIVLVEKQLNAEKTDRFPILSAIQSKQKGFWKLLWDRGFISEKKYDRLVRTTDLTDEELNQFINRQMVSTNQSVKAVTTLLHQLYPETEVVFSKAENVSDFRRDYGFVKVRSINHHHHAKDAYLNIVVGNVYHEKFTKNFLSFAKQKGTHRTYNLTKMFEYEIKLTEESKKVIWDPNIHMEIVKKMMKSNDVRVTQRAVPQKGGLSDETIYKKGIAKRGVYLPLKSSDERVRDVEKYGGRTSITISEYIILNIRDTSDQDRIEIFSLPLYIAGKKDIHKAIEEAYLSTCKKPASVVDIQILYRGLYIGSKVNINGFTYYMGGKTGSNVSVDSAVDVVMDITSSVYIKLLEKVAIKKIENSKTFRIENIKTSYNHKEVTVSKEQNITLYQELLKKLDTPLFSKMKGNKLEEFRTVGFGTFKALSLEDQASVLLEVLNVLTNFKTKRDITKIGMTSSRSTLGINISNTEQFSVITTSITGLYEQEIKIK